jgi:hypothetical protein
MRFDARVPNIGRIEVGEQKIVELLRWDRNFPRGPTNQPKIVIHDTCPNLIAALENYGVPATHNPAKESDLSRSDEFKDPIDALRYTVLYPVPYGMGAGGGVWDTYEEKDWETENRTLYSGGYR